MWNFREYASLPFGDFEKAVHEHEHVNVHVNVGKTVIVDVHVLVNVDVDGFGRIWLQSGPL